uniref:Uncharacterized protein n=1 Tax=Romanomermis culicivorax TaxID=13658 RepID=A0A915IMZ2_ROMCU
MNRMDDSTRSISPPVDDSTIAGQ